MILATLILSILALLAVLAQSALLAVFFACWWFRAPLQLDPAVGNKLASEFMKALPMRPAKATPVATPAPE
jgi:hypothetical protein